MLFSATGDISKCGVTVPAKWLQRPSASSTGYEKRENQKLGLVPKNSRPQNCRGLRKAATTDSATNTPEKGEA